MLIKNGDIIFDSSWEEWNYNERIVAAFCSVNSFAVGLWCSFWNVMYMVKKCQDMAALHESI
jgi:hypothetical protein